ncbi:MAG: NAD-dependent epimerase/dehydratase family protein [Armatimonadetes bacterium]|nr:NAD-dependent epimerase/dehydratase family protein [Armatimonadota bacterium]
MKIVVIGGTGHIGTCLVPRLFEAGHEVVVIHRGRTKPYQKHAAWQVVRQIEVDRSHAEKEGRFAPMVADLKPDVAVDLISFHPDTTLPLVEALQGNVQHFLHCGTIWIKGHLTEAPMTEESISEPIDDYGRNKLAIQNHLLGLARKGLFPATVVHPGHVTGPGYPIANPAGNHNPAVFARLARGETLYLPNFGMETLHHVHADDVAQVFVRAIQNWSASVGEAFFAVSPAAVTLRGYAAEVSRWFNQTPDLRFAPWEEWKKVGGFSESDIEGTYGHIIHSQCCSIEKARLRLGYQPRYTSYEAAHEAVNWMIEHQIIEI